MPLSTDLTLCSGSDCTHVFPVKGNVQIYGGSEEQLAEDEELRLPVRPEDTPTKDLAIIDDGETEVYQMLCAHYIPVFASITCQLEKQISCLHHADIFFVWLVLKEGKGSNMECCSIDIICLLIN